jgi:CHASE2 domain-containing sensor protein
MKKPLHKHIGHHARKGYSKVTKYLTERDTLFATLWVFIFIFALNAIPLNLGVMNPLKLGLKDFDFNDLSYKNFIKSSKGKYDNRITIVNIGHLNREELSMLIDAVGAVKPKVMGLDAYFDGARDPYQDSLLSESFKRNKNLIVGRKLVLSGKDGDTARITGDYIKTAWKYAHVNIFTDSLSTIRTFEPFFEDYKHDKYTFFATALVKEYDTVAYKKLEKKGAKKVVINYTRNVDRYSIISAEELMTGQFDSSLIFNRIVLLGYVNLDPNDLEDKKFTPMNSRFAGKTIPDLNGVYIHANIISMALDDNYIKKVPLWGNLLLAILVCWLHMSFFVHYYLESHIWFHLAAKIAQVISAILFVWLGIFLFDEYRLKVDMKYSLVTILLAVDVIYFYEAWAVWMHKKFNYKTVFKPHHH